jgi:hypothetical protein
MILILLKKMNKYQTSKLEFLFFLFVYSDTVVSLSPFLFFYICRVYFFKLFSSLIIHNLYFYSYIRVISIFYCLLCVPGWLNFFNSTEQKHRTVFFCFHFAFDRVYVLMNLMNSLFYL